MKRSDHTFYRLKGAGDNPELCGYLESRIKEFGKERDQVRDQILHSRKYTSARRAYGKTLDQAEAVLTGNSEFDLKNLQSALFWLREAFRAEELHPKRKVQMLRLCGEAREIYQVLSDLYEGLRPNPVLL